MSDRVWSIKLADDQDHQGEDAKVNSDRILRMSVWPSSGPPLTVSQVCRKAVESSPEWMMKISQRFHKVKTKKDRTVVIKLQYGAGYETLLLLDGAALPESVDDSSILSIAIESVVAPVATEASPELALMRRQTYGVNVYGDESKCCVRMLCC